MQLKETEVLIVGLGPVGDVLAALLGQAGIRVIAIEREPAVYPQPRAVVFDAEIMRTFQQLGIAEKVLPHTQDGSTYEFVNAQGRTLLRFESRDSTAGWDSYLFYQPAIEAVLRERIAELGSVETRLGHAFEHIVSNDETGIVALCRDAYGNPYQVQARFMVGCDGGSSRIRKALGVSLFDYGFEERWLAIDTKVSDESGLSPHTRQICDPQRPVTEVPLGAGRRRWEFMLRPGEEREAMLADVQISELLRPFIAPEKVEVVRRAVYRFHGLVARRWRVGSTLLAGDAAHQMPPFLGQGMCAGIRDAANLAWKLAAVLRGQAGLATLDSYQLEREPHVRHVIELAISLGRTICTLDPEVAARRDAEMLAVQSAGAAREGIRLPGLSGGIFSKTLAAGQLFPQPQASLADGTAGRLDTLLGDGFWLLTNQAYAGAPVPGLRIVHWGTDARDEGTVDAWLSKHQVTSVIVRPDRHVFGAGDSGELVRALKLALESSTVSPSESAEEAQA